MVIHSRAELSRPALRWQPWLSHGVSADPDHTRTWEFALDALDIDQVRTFWCAVLGYEMAGDSDIADPDGLYPPVYVQQMAEMRTGRNRIHIDVGVPHDQAEARVTAALAAGGTLVSDRFAPDVVDAGRPRGQRGRPRHLDRSGLSTATSSTPTWSVSARRGHSVRARCPSGVGEEPDH